MRRVFFSFHFQRDCFKVGQIRNSWLGNANHDAQPYLDKAEWEALERQGDVAIKNWIDRQINGTSVTVVLMGAATLQRRWVRYEMDKTLDRGAGLLGISLTGMRDITQQVEYAVPETKGSPFETKFMWDTPRFKHYNWVNDNGRQNLSAWIEQAAKDVGR